MNFKHALRKLSPRSEVWGRIPDDHFFRQRVSKSHLFGLDPFDWLIIRHVFFQILIALLLAALFVAIGLVISSARGIDIVSLIWTMGILMVGVAATLVFYIMALLTSGSADHFLKLFLRTTGLKNFDSVLTFSPSELESFCRHRLRHLAKEVMTTEADFLPLDDKRTVAREAMREAYWFFRQNGFVPETHWKHFFQ